MALQLVVLLLVASKLAVHVMALQAVRLLFFVCVSLTAEKLEIEHTC
jgi:hypothetical protein